MSEYYAVERSGTSLTHHGIKGMKWGIRRYQNKDGSLTSAGREHYGTGEGNKKSGSKDDKYASVKKAASRGGIIGGLVERARVKRKEKAAKKAEAKAEKQSKVEEKKQSYQVKRFVNKDGSLTSEGVKKYFDGNSDDKNLTKAGKRAFFNDDGSFTELGKKQVELRKDFLWDLNDDEIKRWFTDKESLRRDIEKDLDTSGIKDKNEKLKHETAILDRCQWTPERESTWKEVETYVMLQKKTKSESGDWYFSEGVSPGFKKYVAESDKIRNEQWDVRKKYGWNSEQYKSLEDKQGKLDDEMLGTVLRDIGYEDNEESRRKLRPVVIWD